MIQVQTTKSISRSYHLSNQNLFIHLCELNRYATKVKGMAWSHE